MLELLPVLLVLAVGHVAAQDPNCDFFQSVQLGQTYYVYSPRYSANYPPGVQCRWIAECPPGYNCALNCDDVLIPQSDASCSMDRLLISKAGDPQLASADYYCGRGTLTAVSTGQRISVGLITAARSPGGRFRCRLYAQASSPTPDTCRCGYKKMNRIVGGQETGVNEFPPMVGIIDARIYQIKCGGVIISSRYVLSAAHCFIDLPMAYAAVVVGEHDVNTGDSPATRAFRVNNIVQHPRFTTSNYDYDIAIVTVAEDIPFSGLVGPVCLPFKFAGTDMTGAKLTILGWGTLYPGGPTSNVLRKVDVDVISQSSCQARVSSLTPRQICTLTPGKDACQDDSGGPLLYTDPSNGLLYSIGIVSNGQFCASNSPGVNTRVPVLLDWITSNTPGASFCRK